jgi:hypothetical protein
MNLLGWIELGIATRKPARQRHDEGQLEELRPQRFHHFKHRLLNFGEKIKLRGCIAMIVSGTK